MWQAVSWKVSFAPINGRTEQYLKKKSGYGFGTSIPLEGAAQ